MFPGEVYFFTSWLGGDDDRGDVDGGDVDGGGGGGCGYYDGYDDSRYYGDDDDGGDSGGGGGGGYDLIVGLLRARGGIVPLSDSTAVQYSVLHIKV